MSIHIARRQSCVILLAVGGCGTLPEAFPLARSITLASDVAGEIGSGSILLDVRGPTERHRERHHTAGTT